MFKMANKGGVNSSQDNQCVNQWRVWGQLLENLYGGRLEHVQFNSSSGRK